MTCLFVGRLVASYLKFKLLCEQSKKKKKNNWKQLVSVRSSHCSLDPLELWGSCSFQVTFCTLPDNSLNSLKSFQ